MKNLVRPGALKKGDIVATVSLSAGLPSILPDRYNQGKKQFENALGVKIIEMPNTLKSPVELYDNPEFRLADLMAAFQNPEVKAILTCIGGNDTIRLLRHMDERHFDIIKSNPKIFLGMSDTTANHLMMFKAGLGSFYSASLMFGYAENCGIPNCMIENTKKTLFDAAPIGVLPEFAEFIVDRIDWATGNDIMRPRMNATPWRYVQGDKIAKGRLLGGCVEVLNMINGTMIWPEFTEWEDTILFIETSEEMPPPEYVLYTLRNFGTQGILDRVNGILFARPGGEFNQGDASKRDEYIANYEKFDDVIVKACREYGRSDLPVVTNLCFGHTVPQIILPFGAMTEINPMAKTVSILESAVC